MLVLGLMPGHFTVLVEDIVPAYLWVIFITEDNAEATLHKRLQSLLSPRSIPFNQRDEIFSHLILVLKMQAVINVVTQKDHREQLDPGLACCKVDIAAGQQQPY
jgi:hypothetical protein